MGFLCGFLGFFGWVFLVGFFYCQPCYEVDDDWLSGLLASCPELIRLDLRGKGRSCYGTQISIDGLRRAARERPHLKILEGR